MATHSQQHEKASELGWAAADAWGFCVPSGRQASFTTHWHMQHQQKAGVAWGWCLLDILQR
jgi:hypothetical protein